MIRTNPLTGQLEDDGLPDVPLDGAAPPLVDPNDPDLAAPAPPVDLQSVQPGTAVVPAAAPATPAAAPAAAPAPAGVQAATIFPPKAEHETKVETSQKQGGLVESAATKAADAKLQAERDKEQAAIEADTAIKVKKAEAEAEDKKLARLTEEKKQAGEAYWQDQKRRKIEENMAADRAAVEQSAKDEDLKNNAGILTGAAKTWATVLTAIGTIGQGLAAAGSRGAQAWQDGNPIAKLYEEDRQKAQAKALADFKKSERYRELQKAGREAELKIIEDRLTIGVNNEFKRDTDLREAILAERIAKQGPQAQKVAGDLLKAGKAETYATIDRENASKYDQHLEQGRSLENINRSPTGGSPASQLAQQKLWVPDPKTGQPIPAPDVGEPEVAAARKGYAALTGLRDWKERMVAFVDAHGPSVNDWDPTTKNEYGALQTEAAAYLTKLNESGVLNEGEFKRYSEIAGPGGLKSLLMSKGGLKAGLDEIVTGADARYSGTVKSLVPSYGRAAKASPAAANDTGPKTDLGKQAAARMAPPAWKGVRRVISSGTYERTGPGDNDWKKVKGK